MFFSVVMPIYNTEEYLRDSIESVVNQTVGFEDNIQLILVNDGSTDSSGDICQEYAELYPDNIVYVFQENQGVSAACNKGIEYATGDYVNYMGSDDKWGSNSFAEFKSLITANKYREVDVFSCRMIMFGAKHGEHILNYKYEKDAIVSLNRKPDFIQLTLGNCFIKRDALTEVKSKEGMQYAEDALLINRVLVKNPYLGTSKNARLYYRKRIEKSSLSDTAGASNDRYLKTPKECFLALFDESKKLYGKVLPFLQYAVMYEMQWRIAERLPESMSKKDVEEYELLLRTLLQDIDDKVIHHQKDLPVRRRTFVYRLKHGYDVYRKALWKDGRAYYKKRQIFSLRGLYRIIWQILEVKEDKLYLSGITDFSALGVPYEVYAEDTKGKKYKVTNTPWPVKDEFAFNGEFITRGTKIDLEIPLKHGQKVGFFVSINGKVIHQIRPAFGWFAKLNESAQNSYYENGEYIIKLINDRVCVYKYHLKTHIASETRLVRELRELPLVGNRAPFLRLRRRYFLSRILGRKERIWVLTDRNENATDNASALFKYAATKAKKDNIKMYFVLSKDSVDYPELSKYGTIVEPYSFRHQLLILRAEKVISAYADGPVIQPFVGPAVAIKDIYNADFVYLQHGVMQGELSDWLNRFSKNIKLLVTSTKRETEEIIGGNYGYTEREVKLLGSPRFDNFSKFQKKKKMVIMPTWRKDLSGSLIGITRERRHLDYFEETDYCQFYNHLINNSKLIDLCEHYGYEAEFYLHPNYEKQIDNFYGNEVIKVISHTADYQKVLGESAIMLTDYSGIQFDFAYQYKPIVYTQFDDLYEGGQRHSYQRSYFNYETDGFGPVVKTVEEAVDEVEKIMKNGGEIDPIYAKRVDEFFYYHDEDSSERVYEELVKCK